MTGVQTCALPISIAEVRDTFLHYWQGRRRIYMANQIQKSLSDDWNDLTPPKEWAEMNPWKIRAYNYYYGITHAFSGWSGSVGVSQSDHK